MKIFTSFLFLALSILFTSELYTQREDWITIYDENNKGDGAVDISIKENSIQIYPLKEIALYLYTHLPFWENNVKKYNFVMSRIRFECYTHEYTVVSSYEWSYEKTKHEMVQVQNSKYIEAWREFFKKKLASLVWKFVFDYLER